MHLDEATRQILAELHFAGIPPSQEDALKHGIVRPGTLPPTALGMPQLPQSPIPPPQIQSPWLPTAPPSGPPMQPNGLPDLSKAPAFGERGFGAGLEKFGPGILSELAPLAMGPVLGRAMQLAPRATLAAAGWLTDPSKAGGAPPAKRARSEDVSRLTYDARTKFRPKHAIFDLCGAAGLCGGCWVGRHPIDKTGHSRSKMACCFLGSRATQWLSGGDRSCPVTNLLPLIRPSKFGLSVTYPQHTEISHGLRPA